MRKRFLKVSLLVFFLYAVCYSSSLRVHSDRMEVDERENVVIFLGNVDVKKDDLRIKCDKLVVYYENVNGKREVVKLEAEGRVKIEKEKWRAESERAVYYKKEDKLVLEGNPRVWHNEDEIRGAVVIVYFSEERSEVLSGDGQRVEVFVHMED